MGSPRHCVPEATSENGDINDAPTAGVDTTTLVAVELDEPWTTLMGTSVVHEAPWFPHDLTCSTWAPSGEETLADTEVPDATVVLELSSSEKPIDAIGCDEQGLAVAEKVKGEVTVAPLAGLLTVTLEKAGAAQSSARVDRQRAFIKRGSLTVSLQTHIGLQDPFLLEDRPILPAEQGRPHRTPPRSTRMYALQL
jgi:hypothetical protein